MAEIERFLPSSIKPKQGMSPGVTRPGMNLTDFGSGYKTSRDWSDQNVRELNYPVEMIGYATDGLAEFSAFLESVRVQGEVFWIKEPISGSHYGVPCGPLGDGSRTCFPVPIYSMSNGVVMADGIPVDYTDLGPANLLHADGWANPDGSKAWAIANGATSEAQFSRFGRQSMKIVGTGAADWSISMNSADRFPVSAGDTITPMVDVFDTKSGGRSIRIAVIWYDGTGAISASSTSDIVLTGGVWEVAEGGTMTAPALTESAYMTVEETTSNTEPIYLDAFAIAPEDYDRIHLPSMAPTIVEIAAPAEGDRVTANGTGERLVRGRLASNGVSWSMTDPGNATPSSIKVEEEVEV